MNTKNLTFTIFTLFAVILTACGAASQATVVVEYRAPAEAPVYAAEPTAAPGLPAPGSGPTPRDTTFQDYGVNPMEDTSEDHLSTFALDVDTASYSVARNYVMDGNLPPADAIRVEEFVNYFDPGYPNPEGVAFAIYADGAPSPFHGDDPYILRFGVQGYQTNCISSGWPK